MRIFAAFIILMLCFSAKSQDLKFKTGDAVPVFTAVSHSGKEISSTATGTTILLFYRGYWCPYCNKQLSALNDSLSFLQAKGATVVAVTPEKYESVDKTIEKTKASFEIISDTSNQLLKLFGVDFKVDEKTVDRYKKFGVDFSIVNGNDNNTLPVPAVFIIKDGLIKKVWFDKDYRKRPTVQELLNDL